MRLAIILALCTACFGQAIDATTLGIDCSGKVDNSPTWQKIVNAAGEDAAFTLPTECIDMHGSTVTVSSRASFRLSSSDRVQNGGGNRRPVELWAGTSGGMWDFQANQAPTVEGFLFTNTTPGDYYLRFGGAPSIRIGTEALVRYNTFTNTLNNPNFTAVSIVPNGNGEKNVITDNDFFCSQSSAIRESDTTQITAASPNVVCGAGNCSYLSDAHVGDRLRASYATGIFDSTVLSVTDNNNLIASTNAASTQSGARLHLRQAYGNGILIASVNAKHNTIDRNSFTQCACGLNVINGSFSSQHYGGSSNDVLACIGNISEPSELAYLEDENSLRDVATRNLDAPLTISHARNSIYNAESDGFIYFDASARVTLRESTVQSQLPFNAVLIRAANPRTVVLLSLGNLWPIRTNNLGYNQWRNIAGPQGALISCGDFGMADGNDYPSWPITCGSWNH